MQHPKTSRASQHATQCALEHLGCKQCKRTTIATKWLCTCLKRWQLCTEHAPIAFLCGRQPVRLNDPNHAGCRALKRASELSDAPPPKRRHITSEASANLIKRVRPGPSVWNNKVPRLLPPKLEAKFAHLRKAQTPSDPGESPGAAAPVPAVGLGDAPLALVACRCRRPPSPPRAALPVGDPGFLP